jgi:hypothetical protein
MTTAGDFVGFQCGTADEEPWARVVPGQKVKLKGRMPQDAFLLAINDCVWVEVGPSEAIVINAEQLGKEYAADREATNKKYDGKWLRLKGEIVSKEVNSAGAPRYILKTANNVKVGLSFPASAREDFPILRSWRPGRQVEVVGEYSVGYQADNVGLQQCLPLKK